MHVCATRKTSSYLLCLIFLFLIILFFCWQPSLFRPAILSELWAREHLIAIPPASLWPGKPEHHHHHHKCNHFITGTRAAAEGAWHLSLSLSPPQLAAQPEYKTFTLHSKTYTWRLIDRQTGKKEHFQFELGGEASESGVAQSGSLGDDGPQWSREREAVRHPLKVCVLFTTSAPLIHRSDFASSHVIPTVQIMVHSSGVFKTKATECARAIL